jgi:2-polyprenyl-6-methoxyphenol hydroxylase-like FAD-dependent oxidoreductase
VSDSFDVIVVGARCAGAPLATLLARAGLNVCVVDKARFPSDTPSTHAMQPSGVDALERLGVLDRLLELAPPIRRAQLLFDDFTARVDDISALVGKPVLSVRRPLLDTILVEAAAQAGADMRTGTAVTGLLQEDGRVVGVSTPAGELRAPLVVGADGMHSTVARLAGASEYAPTANGRVFMWGYYAGDPTGGEMWLGKLGDNVYLVTPTDSGLCMVATGPSLHRRDEVRRDRDGVYEQGIRSWPQLAEAVAGMSREGSIRTMANMPGFFRESAGPGWVLVGDAGHFKDPTPGQGIADALRQAEKLAPAIVRALGGGHGDPDAVLREWWRWRDDDAWEMYWFAHDMGKAGPTPPLLLESQRLVASDPDMMAASMRMFSHEMRPSELLTPAFALRATAHALRAKRGHRRAIVREAREFAADDVRRRLAARRLRIVPARAAA